MATCEVCGRPPGMSSDPSGHHCARALLEQSIPGPSGWDGPCYRLGYARAHARAEQAEREKQDWIRTAQHMKDKAEQAERERDEARQAREVVLAEARRLAGGWQHKAEKHLHQKRVAEEQRDAAEARAVAAEAALAEARAEARALQVELLRAYVGHYREGWENGPSTDEAFDRVLSILCSAGLDPGVHHEAVRAALAAATPPEGEG